MLTGHLRDRSLFMGGRGPEILGRGPLIFGKSLKGGATYFWQVAERGGHLFLARKNLKKPAKSIFLHIFLRDFGEGATYFWQVAERGGPLIFGSFEKQNLRPPPAHK